MLKVRVIPTLLWKQFGLVKGIGFDSWRRVGPVLPAVKVYNQREVDELILVDIVAHQSADDLDFESIDEFSQDCFIPLTVGGGINRIEQVQKLLRAGADKVSVNTAAVERPDLISEIAAEFGVQCVVCAIDARRRQPDEWEVYLHGGRTPTGLDAVEWAIEAVRLGAGELLLTSMDRDGTREGFDVELTRAISDAVNVPIIASGGVGALEHLADGVIKGGADAVLAASIFHFREHTVAEAKAAMTAAGITVRPAV